MQAGWSQRLAGTDAEAGVEVACEAETVAGTGTPCRIGAEARSSVEREAWGRVRVALCREAGFRPSLRGVLSCAV